MMVQGIEIDPNSEVYLPFPMDSTIELENPVFEVSTNFVNMTPSESTPSYRHAEYGLYKIEYQGEMIPDSIGIPVNKLFALITLRKTTGTGPEQITTTLYDFQKNFHLVDLLTETPTKAPSTKKASK